MKNDYLNDEITIKELISILLDGWKVVVYFIVFGIMTGLFYSYILVKPIYESEIEIFMVIPETKTTEVGVYNYPSSNPKDYFDLLSNTDIVNRTIEMNDLENNQLDFVKKITIQQEKNSNVVSVLFKGDNPDKIAEILNSHVKNFQNYLSYHFKKDAINQFITEGKVLSSLKKSNLIKSKKQHEKAMLKLNQLSPTIPLQKALTTNPEIAAQYARDNGITVAELSNQLLIEEIVNTNYTSAEKLVNDLEVLINTLEIEVLVIDDQLEMLEKEKLNIENSDEFEESESDFLSVLSLSIKQVAPANIPVDKVSPNRGLNTIISLVMFGLFGVFFVFFREYWQKN